MNDLTFLTCDIEGVRWWVLRGPQGAVSLTAVHLPPGTDTLITEIAGPGGLRLMPDCFDVHCPGEVEPACPALGASCDGGVGAISGARQALEEWAAAGHDDTVLARWLGVMYAQEVSA